MNETRKSDHPQGSRDEELADCAAMGADVLRAMAQRWRSRIQAGRLGRHSPAEAEKLVSDLEAAAKLVERAGERRGQRTDARLESLEALRRSEEQMRLMVASVRDYAIFLLDSEGYIRSWNIGAERLNGYTVHEIIGRHFSIFYPDEARRLGHPDYELRRAKAEGRYEEEGWRIRKDGSRFWANVVITPLFDPDGRHVGFTKVTRDFTERREAEDKLRQSEERFRLIIDNVPDYAIFMLDPQGVVMSWNLGAQRITSYTESEIIGKPFSIFYPPADIAAGRPERELRIAAAEGRYEEEGWRLRKGGELFWANVVITSVYDANRTLRGFAKVTRDLTERRRMEQEAREAEQQAIQERMRALEAQSAVRHRDEFISIAAHELRTPLTALQLKLQGTAQLLKKGGDAAPAPPPKLMERLEGAVRNVQRLTELVERLLDVSRILGGKLGLSPEQTDLAALVRQIVEDFREPASQVGSELRLKSPGALVGTWDKARIEQVIVNIVSNAIKYGDGKPIDIELRPTDAGAELAVTDRGIGIAPEDLERIFGRFERAAPNRHYGGLGLGLYVARNIVEAHGGSIRVSSSPGQGSTFVVELPKRSAVAGSAPKRGMELGP